MAKGKKIGELTDGGKKLNIMKTKGKGSKVDFYYIKPINSKKKRK
jgi:hypothetical protein